MVRKIIVEALLLFLTCYHFSDIYLFTIHIIGGSMKRTRAEAIAVNEAHYNTGKPCKQGHFSIRYTTTTECVECRRQWGKNEREKVKALRQQFSNQ